MMPATELKTFTTSDFRLANGSVLGEVTIAYRTVGTLAPNRDNVVLVTHGNYQRAADDRSRRIDRRRQLK